MRDIMNTLLRTAREKEKGVDFHACVSSFFCLLVGKKQHRNIFSHKTGWLAKFGWILTYGVLENLTLNLTYALLLGTIQLLTRANLPSDVILMREISAGVPMNDPMAPAVIPGGKKNMTNDLQVLTTITHAAKQNQFTINQSTGHLPKAHLSRNDGGVPSGLQDMMNARNYRWVKFCFR